MLCAAGAAPSGPPERGARPAASRGARGPLSPRCVCVPARREGAKPAGWLSGGRRGTWGGPAAAVLRLWEQAEESVERWDGWLRPSGFDVRVCQREAVSLLAGPAELPVPCARR